LPFVAFATCQTQADQVIDIREQYPLLEIEDTIQIANKLGIRHPADEITGLPYAITTDFLIILNSGQHIARTVKPSKELERTQVLGGKKYRLGYCYRKKYTKNFSS